MDVQVLWEKLQRKGGEPEAEETDGAPSLFLPYGQCLGWQPAGNRQLSGASDGSDAAKQSPGGGVKHRRMKGDKEVKETKKLKGRYNLKKNK